LPIPVRNTASAYGLISQLFHWLIVALILVQYAWAWRIDQADGIRARLELVTQHKTIGMSVLALAVMRLMWRLFSRPPPLPVTMQPWERAAAKAGHWLLYVLIFAVPVSGWAYSSAAGYGDYWWGPIDFPSILSSSDRLQGIMAEVHRLLAISLGVLAGGHALAALGHHCWNRDDGLKRMLPLWRNDS